MAVNKSFNSKTLALVHCETDANGKTTTTRKSFPNVKASATNDQIYAVASSIMAVLDFSIDDVQIVENASLSEV